LANVGAFISAVLITKGRTVVLVDMEGKE